MSGKYAKIIPGLPKLVDTEGKSPDYQQRINFAKDNFRKASTEDPERQHVILKTLLDNAVDVVRKRVGITDRDGVEPGGTELVTAYARLRYEEDKLDELRSELQVQLTALEQMIDDSQERGANGWGDFGATENTCKLITGESVNVQREPYAQVTDRDAVRLWAMNTGLERSLTLPWQTLNSHAKELMTLGEPLPPGVKIWARTKITFRKK